MSDDYQIFHLLVLDCKAATTFTSSIWSTSKTVASLHRLCSLELNSEDVSFSGPDNSLKVTGVTLTAMSTICHIDNKT